MRWMLGVAEVRERKRERTASRDTAARIVARQKRLEAPKGRKEARR
jgi:hypothetical protein